MVQAFTPAKGMRGGRLGRGGSGGSVMTQYGYSTPGANISLSNIGNPVVTQNTGTMTQGDARPVRQPEFVSGGGYGGGGQVAAGTKAPGTSTYGTKKATGTSTPAAAGTTGRYDGPTLKGITGKKAAKPSVQKFGSDDNKIGKAEAKKIVDRLGSDKGYKKVTRVAAREGVKVSDAAQKKLDTGRQEAVTTRKVDAAGKKIDKKEAKDIIKKLDLKENKGVKAVIKEAKKQDVKIGSGAQKKLDAAIKARKANDAKKDKKKDKKKGKK